MRKVLVTIFAVVMMVFCSQSAFATTSIFTQQQVQELKQRMTNLGIDQVTQEKLIEKMEQGKRLDSDDPTQVKAAEKDLAITPLHPHGRHRFPDGSVITTNLTGGTESCGSGYCNWTGVKVTRDTVAVGASFLANYTTVNGGDSYISNAYQPIVSVIGSYSNMSLTIPIPSQTSTYAAQATLTFDVSSMGSMQTYYLYLYVGDTAWQDASW